MEWNQPHQTTCVGLYPIFLFSRGEAFSAEDSNFGCSICRLGPGCSWKQHPWGFSGPLLQSGVILLVQMILACYHIPWPSYPISHTCHVTGTQRMLWYATYGAWLYTSSPTVADQWSVTMLRRSQDSSQVRLETHIVDCSKSLYYKS